MFIFSSSTYKSIIITSPNGFNIALTNIDATLKQRCTTSIQRQCPTLKQHRSDVAQRRNNLAQRWYNIVSTSCKVVSTLYDIVSTLFQRRALTLYRRCATLKIQRQNLFHFQRQNNVISTLGKLVVFLVNNIFY